MIVLSYPQLIINYPLLENEAHKTVLLCEGFTFSHWKIVLLYIQNYLWLEVTRIFVESGEYSVEVIQLLKEVW